MSITERAKDMGVEELVKENRKLKEKIDELEKEINELKRCRSIEIETCNRYREKCDGLEKENKKLKEKLNNAGLEEYGFFNEY